MSPGIPELSDGALAALSSRPRLRVLLLCESRSWTVSELAAETGVTRQTALHHVSTLRDAGLLQEASRQPISGGSLISYRSVGSGWAGLVRAANDLAHGSDGDGA